MHNIYVLAVRNASPSLASNKWQLKRSGLKKQKVFLLHLPKST